MPYDITTAVLRNTDLGHGNFLIEFGAAPMVAAMKPAQFFMIGIPGSAPLLRRPYSVCGLPGTFDEGAADAVQVLYKVVGQGTGLLAALAPGAPLRVLGPLGRGFEAPADGHTRPVFVAGGIGSAPFPALSVMLAGRAPAPWMFYGARSRAELPLADWFARRVERLTLTTEDGSAGVRGMVTAPLRELVESSEPGTLHLYACGPEPMLRAVAALVRGRGLACDLSLEAHMACGFGVCLGCVVPVRTPGSDEVRFDRVCVEGPVMDAGMLAW